MDDNNIMEMDYDIRNLIRLYNDLRVKKDDIERSMEGIKTKLSVKMGTNKQIVDDNGEVVVNRLLIDKATFYSSELKKEMPDIYNKFIKMTTSDQLRIKGDR